jgi:phosphoribosylformylglycinamidine synthase
MHETKITIPLIDQIPEPKDIQSVIYSMVAIPHLSPVDSFGTISDLGVDPSEFGKDDASEAGIFEIDGENKLFSLTIYADHRRLVVDPEDAAEILVSKAVRRLMCYGVEPVAFSAYLNHVDVANPVDQNIVSSTRIGLENAAATFNIKISHRKVNFDYHEEHGTVTPTLIVSLVGRLVNSETLMSSKFKNKGNNIFVIGRSVNDIYSSEYLHHYHEIKESPLMHFDLSFEPILLDAVKELIEKKLVESVSPVGVGGMFFSLLRAALPNDLGFDITTDAEIREDAFLFGEAMGRVFVGVESGKEDDFLDYMTSLKIPFFALGHVTKGEIRVDDESFGFIDKMTESSEER